jgi:mRNA interferase HigB
MSSSQPCLPLSAKLMPNPLFFQEFEDCSHFGKISLDKLLGRMYNYDLMIIVGREKLADLAGKHADARNRISAWIAEAESAEWKKPKDVKDRYPSASILADNIIIFELGNEYRLEVQLAYKTGKIIVRRIGKHSEYNRWSR